MLCYIEAAMLCYLRCTKQSDSAIDTYVLCAQSCPTLCDSRPVAHQAFCPGHFQAVLEVPFLLRGSSPPRDQAASVCSSQPYTFIYIRPLLSRFSHIAYYRVLSRVCWA